MGRLVDADLAALTLSLAGRFTPTGDMWALAARTDTALSQRLFPRIRQALRPGVNAADVSFVLEILASVKLSDSDRTRHLRRRYLAAVLDGLRAESGEALPGPPPTQDEINERWEPAGQPEPRAARRRGTR